MRDEHRKHRRQTLRYRAYVDLCDGLPVRACRLLDVSEQGAQLIMDSAATLPDQFVLLLAEGGQVQRQCRVAWRSEKQIGIRFLTAPAKISAYGRLRKNG